MLKFYNFRVWQNSCRGRRWRWYQHAGIGMLGRRFVSRTSDWGRDWWKQQPSQSPGVLWTGPRLGCLGGAGWSPIWAEQLPSTGLGPPWGEWGPPPVTALLGAALAKMRRCRLLKPSSSRLSSAAHPPVPASDQGTARSSPGLAAARAPCFVASSGCLPL